MHRNGGSMFPAPFGSTNGAQGSEGCEMEGTNYLVGMIDIMETVMRAITRCCPMLFVNAARIYIGTSLFAQG